uniref:Uncharacterized protein n=1 Tax=Panagrolaimus sp. ES5 TaxID=591445 RepID=A0AC34FNE7_9BILA
MTGGKAPRKQFATKGSNYQNDSGESEDSHAGSEAESEFADEFESSDSGNEDSSEDVVVSPPKEPTSPLPGPASSASIQLPSCQEGTKRPPKRSLSSSSATNNA